MDDWRRVSFQLSLSTTILNKCINAILTINCSQAFDNTIHFVMKKKEKEKERGEKGFKIAASGTVKTELIICRSSGT